MGELRANITGRNSVGCFRLPNLNTTQMVSQLTHLGKRSQQPREGREIVTLCHCGKIKTKVWRPPGRWVVREDTVSESQFLGSPGAAAETMLDISSDQHSSDQQSLQLLTVN